MAAPGLGPATQYRTPVQPYQSDQTYDPGRIAKAGYNWVSNKLSSIGNALTPKQPDLSGVQQAQANAFGLQNQLGAERAGYTGNYNPANDTSLASQQQANINALAQAAAGKVPSPAELQLQQQAARNAASQYGLAAALQGRSPGAALRQASMGSVQTQADANAQAAIQRAQEQQAAQAQLVNALQSARGQGQNLLQNDTDYRKALLAGQIGALGAGTTAAGNEAQAQAQAAAAKNSLLGGLISGGAGILGAIL